MEEQILSLAVFEMMYYFAENRTEKLKFLHYAIVPQKFNQSISRNSASI